MTEPPNRSKGRRPDDVQQGIFRSFQNSQWEKYDENNMEDCEKNLENFLVNTKAKDVKTFVNTIKHLTTSSENRVIYMSIVLLQFFPNIERSEEIEGRAFRPEQYKIEQVLKIRKCHSKSYNDITDGCCIYLDKFGRIYDSWNDFKNNNQYKKGILLGPEGGIYRGSRDNAELVKLESIKTPDLNMLFKLRTLSNASMDFIIAAVAILLMYQQFVRKEVDNHFILAAETTTFASALYGWIVSSAQLFDINTHHIKTNDMFDLKPKRFFLHHTAVVLLGFARLMTFFINMAISSGYTIGTDYEAIHKIIVGSSILISGLAILINGLICLSSTFKNLFKKSDDVSNNESLPTSLEVFMLFSSILYFFNVYATVYGLSVFSSDPKPAGAEDNIAAKKPGAGGRGGRRGGGKAQAAPAKGADKVAEKANSEDIVKLLTFDSTHALFLLMLLVFVPIFMPWLSIMNFL